MSDIDKSRYIYNAFNALGLDLDVPKVSMWSLSDRYAYPPYFRFKFKNVGKGSIVYLKIISVIDKFDGNVKWKVITYDDISNYILIPEEFAFYLKKNISFSKDYFIEVFGESTYHSKIDNAIRDIPLLARSIRSITPLSRMFHP